MWFIFSLNPLKYPDTQKSWASWQNFNSKIMKLTKTLILPNCHMSKKIFISVKVINQKLNFWKIDQLFFVHVEEIWEDWEKVISAYSRPHCSVVIFRNQLFEKKIAFFLRLVETVLAENFRNFQNIIFCCLQTLQPYFSVV